MTGINFSDLSPKYQQQAMKKYMEQSARRGSAPAAVAAQEEPKENKYHSKPTERVTASGAILHFASCKEARRYDELMLLLQAGRIRNLRLQAQYTLQESFLTPEGERVRAIRYVADFAYERATKPDRHGTVHWLPVVEDVKSEATRTEKYKIKAKLFRERYGFAITEV